MGSNPSSASSWLCGPGQVLNLSGLQSPCLTRGSLWGRLRRAVVRFTRTHAWKTAWGPARPGPARPTVAIIIGGQINMCFLLAPSSAFRDFRLYMPAAAVCLFVSSLCYRHYYVRRNTGRVKNSNSAKDNKTKTNSCFLSPAPALPPGDNQLASVLPVSF